MSEVTRVRRDRILLPDCFAQQRENGSTEQKEGRGSQGYFAPSTKDIIDHIHKPSEAFIHLPSRPAALNLLWLKTEEDTRTLLQADGAQINRSK